MSRVIPFRADQHYYQALDWLVSARRCASGSSAIRRALLHYCKSMPDFPSELLEGMQRQTVQAQRATGRRKGYFGPPTAEANGQVLHPRGPQTSNTLTPGSSAPIAATQARSSPAVIHAAAPSPSTAAPKKKLRRGSEKKISKKKGKPPIAAGGPMRVGKYRDRSDTRKSLPKKKG
jgi:hypothetical protein